MSLGNRIWFDVNNDGIDNDGAGAVADSGTGIGNVLVHLFKDSNGNGILMPPTLCQPEHDQRRGCYAFTGLTPTTGSTVLIWLSSPMQTL